MGPIELILLERELRKSSLDGENKKLVATKVEELKKEVEGMTEENSAKLLEILQQIVKVVESEGAERWGFRQAARRMHPHKSTLSIVRRFYLKEKFISQMGEREE